MPDDLDRISSLKKKSGKKVSLIFCRLCEGCVDRGAEREDIAV